jgi:hypothetical protein
MARTTTGERMAKIETKMDYVIDEMRELKELVEKNIEQQAIKIEALEQKDDKKFAHLKKEFAGKPVEWIVYGMVGIILTAVFGAMIMLVLP